MPRNASDDIKKLMNQEIYWQQQGGGSPPGKQRQQQAAEPQVRVRRLVAAHACICSCCHAPDGCG